MKKRRLNEMNKVSELRNWALNWPHGDVLFFWVPPILGLFFLASGLFYLTEAEFCAYGFLSAFAARCSKSRAGPGAQWCLEAGRACCLEPCRISSYILLFIPLLMFYKVLSTVFNLAIVLGASYKVTTK